MSFTKLPNYLKTHRRRAGLSQDEIAFLLGNRSGAHVCRYERFARQPTLATAFALEAIFGVPARELFAGQYLQVEREVRRRAGLLARRFSDSPQDRAAARKLELLSRLTNLNQNP